MFIESFRRNWFLLHSRCFSSPFVTSHGSLPWAHLSLHLWRTLKKFKDAMNFSTRMVFVIISVGFFFVMIFIKLITLSSPTHWHVLWYLASMYFIRLWYLWSLVRWIVFWLSQWTRTKSYMILNVSTNPLNHKASFDNSTAVMYSASIIERINVSCNSAFQLMMYPATMNT